MPDPTITDLIDGVISREGGYADQSADRGGATRWGITEAVARAHGYRGDMRAFPPRRSGGDLSSASIGCVPDSTSIGDIAPDVAAELFRHWRQHGTGGRRRVSSTRAQCTQPRRVAIIPISSRPRPRIDDATRAPRWPSFLRIAAKPHGENGADPKALERACRANATSTSPNAVPPTRRSFTAGWPTALADSAGSTLFRRCRL